MSKLLHCFQHKLNQYLALDPETIERLHKLDGKIIYIQFMHTPFEIYAFFTKTAILLKKESSFTPHLSIKGSPLSLLQLILNKKTLISPDVSIEGDLDLAQHVLSFMESIEIDWEEFFSQKWGDGKTHTLFSFLSRLKKFSQHTKAIFTDNIKEYIVEEKCYFPPKEMLIEFYDAVDQLRMDLDRLECRIHQLMNEVAV